MTREEVWREYFDGYLREGSRLPAGSCAADVVREARRYADEVLSALEEHGLGGATPANRCIGASLGQVGYEAYCDARRPGPAAAWSELSEREQERWEAAGEAIARSVRGKDPRG